MFQYVQTIYCLRMTGQISTYFGMTYQEDRPEDSPNPLAHRYERFYRGCDAPRGCTFANLATCLYHSYCSIRSESLATGAHSAAKTTHTFQNRESKL